MHAETQKSLAALAAALGVDTALGDDPIKALVTIAEHSDSLTRRSPLDDPYSKLVLALAPAPAELEIASRVAGLTPFESKHWQEMGFYVDEHVDDTGRHRVYMRDDELLPGSPHRTLPSIAAFARILIAAAGGERPVVDTVADDEWESGPQSGSFVLETLLRGSLSSMWATASFGELVPKRPNLASEPLPVGPDPIGRTICLHAFRVVRLACALPPLDFEGRLDDAQQAYIDHLKHLGDAAHGVVPDFVDSAAKKPGPLRKAAEEWQQRFTQAHEEAARRAAEDTEESEEDAPPPLTAFEQKLRGAVDEVLAELEAKGDLEIARRDMLLDELTRVAAEARSPKHLLKKLVRALVESDAVEEIYAGDDDVRRAFQKKLRLD